MDCFAFARLAFLHGACHGGGAAGDTRPPVGHQDATAAAGSPSGSKALGFDARTAAAKHRGAHRSLHSIYDPTSTNFRRYLTPEKFTERFGPSEQDYQAVIAFAQANGLIVTGTHPSRTILDVQGAVSDIEKVFNMKMCIYQHPVEPRTFFAPNVEPSASLAVPLLTVAGLDNYVIPRPASLRLKPPNAVPCAGSGTYGTYMGWDFRAAYAPGVSLTGAGQVVGLVQFDAYYANDIAVYEAQAGLPNVPLVNVLLDGFSGIPASNSVGVVEYLLTSKWLYPWRPGSLR